MNRKNIHIAFAGIVLSIATIACSLFGASPSLKLPNYGVFLEKGQSFIELKQHTGVPSESSIRSELEVTSSTPVFLVWYPQIDLQNFLLVNIRYPGRGLPYKVNPRDDKDQILEITPERPLDNDNVYCFYQGDPLGNPYTLPFWCFLAKNSAANVVPTKHSLPTNSMTRVRPSVTPVMQLSPPVTPVVQSPDLNIVGCTSPSDCPPAIAIWDITDFVSLVSPGINKSNVLISVSNNVVFRIGWCAINQDTLHQNFNYMNFFIKVDNVDYSYDLISKLYYRKEDCAPCVTSGVAINGWMKGETYQIDLGFIINQSINDGWDIYGPGDYIDRFNVEVQ